MQRRARPEKCPNLVSEEFDRFLATGERHGLETAISLVFHVYLSVHAKLRRQQGQQQADSKNDWRTVTS